MARCRGRVRPGGRRGPCGKVSAARRYNGHNIATFGSYASALFTHRQPAGSDG